MITPQKATQILRKNLPKGSIEALVEYQNLYLFQVFSDDPMEGQSDPFYSVDKNTGEFKDFCILTDGDISVITDLFVKAKSPKG